MVQPSTLEEFLFMMAFISAWHTYMYFVSNLYKGRKVLKSGLELLKVHTHSLRFSPRAAFHQSTLWKDRCQAMHCNHVWLKQEIRGKKMITWEIHCSQCLQFSCHNWLYMHPPGQGSLIPLLLKFQNVPTWVAGSLLLMAERKDTARKYSDHSR